MLLRMMILAGSILSASVLPASAVIGDWSTGDHVRLRLVGTRSATDGSLQAAIEIELDPGWKTYWRSPGDTGIPPRLDFSGSHDVGEAAISFPAPERSDDGFAVSNVYHNRIVLPVTFAHSAAEPAELRLSADLGVCDDICLPVSLTARLEVPAGEVDSDAAGQLAEAWANIPGPGRPGRFEILSIRRVGGSDKVPEFEATVAVAGSKDALLFAETPPDWYPSAPVPEAVSEEGKATYRFSADRKTATTPLEGASLRLTLTQGGEATSRAFTLDAGGASP